jgi:hypothetical protein
MGEATAAISSAFGFPLSMWWCLRQYYRARSKGYYPTQAATVVCSGMAAVIIPPLALLDSLQWFDWTWFDIVIAIVWLLIFPVSALVVTALVALLPSRSHRAGARRSSFLFSPACRALEVGLVVTGYAVAIGFTVMAIPHIAGWSPVPPPLVGTGGGIIVFLAFSAAALNFTRVRSNAPGLADSVATDARPAVLYLRAFRQESNFFANVPAEELPRYTRRNLGLPWVTFEQYLGAEFSRQLGPFIALGNPLDSVPPEGAARSYPSDEDWQQHFCTLASAAAAIVIDGSHSGNLHWELTEITRNGWQRRLFFLTAPALSVRTGHLLVNTMRDSAKGVSMPSWEQFATELKRTGLHVPPIEPGPGSVIAFDTAGRAEVLIRGAQKPEEFVGAVWTHL